MDKEGERRYMERGDRGRKDIEGERRERRERVKGDRRRKNIEGERS